MNVAIQILICRADVLFDMLSNAFVDSIPAKQLLKI